MAKDVYSSEQTTLYRIGEFAKNLGVTPDFLKHYESLGIIRSEQGENGYRYYRFQEANRIFDCVRLKNLGFTIREAEQMITKLGEDEIIEMCSRNAEDLRRELRYREAFISCYDDFAREQAYLKNADSDWTIENSEGRYFLPHSVARQFIDDPRIYAILPDWMNAMPAVYSSALMEKERPESFDLPSGAIPRVWGFSIKKRHAEALNLPLNGAVIELPACKALHYRFSARLAPGNDRPENYYAVWRKLDELNLKPCGKILGVNNLSAHIEGKLGLNQQFIVPLKME